MPRVHALPRASSQSSEVCKAPPLPTALSTCVTIRPLLSFRHLAATCLAAMYEPRANARVAKTLRPIVCGVGPGRAVSASGIDARTRQCGKEEEVVVMASHGPRRWWTHPLTTAYVYSTSTASCIPLTSVTLRHVGLVAHSTRLRLCCLRSHRACAMNAVAHS